MRALGYAFLCVNDHLLFSRPWLDGPTALAAVIDESGSMQLATTVSLPVLRGPAPSAKTLVALDVLSSGRLVVAVGPGSSARDHAAVGVPFGERWRRFDDAVACLASVLRGGDREGVDGAFYRTGGVVLNEGSDPDRERVPDLPGLGVLVDAASRCVAGAHWAHFGDGVDELGR